MSGRSQKRQSHFFHTSTPSFGGGVPPMPFLPVPPSPDSPSQEGYGGIVEDFDESPPSQPIYAAVPSQPKPQRTTGYIPSSLPPHVQRSYDSRLTISPTYPPSPFSQNNDPFPQRWPISPQSSLHHRTPSNGTTADPTSPPSAVVRRKPSLLAHKQQASFSSAATTWSSARDSFTSHVIAEPLPIQSDGIRMASEEALMAGAAHIEPRAGMRAVHKGPDVPSQPPHVMRDARSEHRRSGSNTGEEIDWTALYSDTERSRETTGEKRESIYSSHSSSRGKSSKRVGCWVALIAAFVLIGAILGSLLWYFLVHNKTQEPAMPPPVGPTEPIVPFTPVQTTTTSSASPTPGSDGGLLISPAPSSPTPTPTPTSTSTTTTTTSPRPRRTPPTDRRY